MGFINFVTVNKYKIFKTFLTYITFSGLGGASTLLGSSLLDIQIRVQRTFETTSRLIPIRCIGYIIGASTSGFFEKKVKDDLILFLANLVAGFFLIIAPWFKIFEVVAICIGISGAAQGLFDIYCNVIVLRIWGKDGTNWLQVLHMFFGVGALVTPLITRPFLLQKEDDTQEALNTLADFGLSNSSLSSLPTNITQPASNETYIGGFSPEQVKVQYAYLILGGMLCLVSIPFFFCYLKERQEKVEKQKEKQVTQETGKDVYKKYGAIVITAVLANIAFGTEVVVGTLGPAFSVKSELHMPKKTGVLLSTVFWSMFSFYRIVFIPLTMFIKDQKLVLLNLLIILAGVVTMVPYAAYNSTLTWISFTLLGIGYSPVFAVYFGSLSNYFEVTGKMTSFIFINGVIGETIHATIISAFMDETPTVYIYYLGTMALIYIVLCFILPIYCRRMFPEAYLKTSVSKRITNQKA